MSVLATSTWSSSVVGINQYRIRLCCPVCVKHTNIIINNLCQHNNIHVRGVARIVYKGGLDSARKAREKFCADHAH